MIATQHLLLAAFGFMDLVFSVPSLAAAAAPAPENRGIPKTTGPETNGTPEN